MPSDEGTGLHAFDDLDPISTVSALNVLPVADPAAPRSAPPGAPGRPGSLPPPPPGSAAGRSVPPPPPAHAGADVTFEDDAEPVADEEFEEFEAEPDALEAESDAFEAEFATDDDDTKVVPNALIHDPEFAQAASSAEAAGPADDEFVSQREISGVEPVAARGPDVALGPQFDDEENTSLFQLPSTTVATNIDMDWDDDEVKTQLRDPEDGGYGARPAPFVGGRPSPFPPPQASVYPGNPSPFASSSVPSFPGRPLEGSWEVPSQTGPVPATSHGYGPRATDSLAPASDTATVAGQSAFDSRRLAWTGLGAALLVGVIIGASTLLAGDDPATITLVTKPADAEVLIDGKPLLGQTSPFMAQEIEPDVEHTLVVRKAGFVEQTHRFKVEEGEVKPLPGIELEQARVDTGFALASDPPGAAIYVDDRKLDQVTPARITDLDPGLHVIRLEHGAGYQPWETQVALASGQVMELPAATLVRAGRPPRAEAAASGRYDADDGVAKRRSRGERARSRDRRAPPPEPRRHASAPAAGAGQGTLRVNSRPWAQVFVDGRRIGNTPQLNIPLSAGKHRLKLVNPDLRMTKTLTVDIKAGKPTTMIVEMME